MGLHKVIRFYASGNIRSEFVTDNAGKAWDRFSRKDLLPGEKTRWFLLTAVDGTLTWNFYQERKN